MDSNTYIPELPIGAASLIGANNYLVLEQLIELSNGYDKYKFNYNKHNTPIQSDGFIGISQPTLAKFCNLTGRKIKESIDMLSKPDERCGKAYITIIKGQERTGARRNLYKVNIEAISQLIKVLQTELIAIPKGKEKKHKYDHIEKRTYEDHERAIYEENTNRLKYVDNETLHPKNEGYSILLF